VSAYRWIGALTKFEQPGSPDSQTNRDRRTWKLHYEGPYDVLSGALPTWGATLDGLPSGARVEGVDCKRESGNVGVLHITLGEFVDGVPAKYTVGREELQKRIETNPRYIASTGQPGTYWANTKEMMMWLAMALNDEAATTPRKYYLDNTTLDPFWTLFSSSTEYPNTPPTLGTPGASNYRPCYYLSLVMGQPGLMELYNKIKDGEDSYIIGAPVVTEEKRVATRPTAEPIYVLEAPPSDSNYPSGYMWIRTKFDADEDGVLFIQKKAWLGADHIDTDIYS